MENGVLNEYDLFQTFQKIYQIFFTIPTTSCNVNFYLDMQIFDLNKCKFSIFTSVKIWGFFFNPRQFSSKSFVSSNKCTTRMSRLLISCLIQSSKFLISLFWDGIDKDSFVITIFFYLFTDCLKSIDNLKLKISQNKWNVFWVKGSAFTTVKNQIKSGFENPCYITWLLKS